MSFNRISNLNVSVFNVGGDYLADLENCTMSVDVHTQEAKGISDEYDYPWVTGRGVTLEADVFVSSNAAILAVAATGTAQVAISYNSGGGSYSGQGIITAASHVANMGALQTQKVTIKLQGGVTIS